jgi:hypothetical protein
MKRLALALTLLALAACRTASGIRGGDAWNYTRTVLPADTDNVMAFNLDAPGAAALYAAVLPGIVERQRLGPIVARVKELCDFDLVKDIRGMVLPGVGTADLVAFFASPRFQPRAVADCLEKLVLDDEGRPGRAHARVLEGGVIEIAVDGRRDPMYLAACPRPGILVMTVYYRQKDSLARWLGGKGPPAGSDLAHAVGKIDDPGASAAWAVLTGIARHAQPSDPKVKDISVRLTVRDGTLQVDGHASLVDAREAEHVKSLAQTWLADPSTRPGLPPELERALATVRFHVTGNELLASASLPVADAAALVPLLW